MKKFIAFLMIGFAILLIAPVQAAVTTHDYNLVVEPPGQTIDVAVTGTEFIYFISNPGMPASQVMLNCRDVIVVQTVISYEATKSGSIIFLPMDAPARDAVTSESLGTVLYSDAITPTKSQHFIFTMPRDGLTLEPGA